MVYTQLPTPILDTPDFRKVFGGEDGKTLELTKEGLLKPVETVLFPGTKVELLEKMPSPFIWRIATEAYPFGSSLFIDERFASSSFPQNMPPLPSTDAILQTIEELMGTRYIWGGNWPEGISSLPTFYPPSTDLHALSPLVQDTWHLKGVDCSGLLYYATQGRTPRNTSALLHWGEEVPIHGLDPKEIASKLQPLDLIVWKGHVVIVLNPCEVIESIASLGGVVKTPIVDRLTQIKTEQRPFVIRRWVPLRSN